MKFILVLKVCYALVQFCGPPIESSIIYDSWYECGVAGYNHAAKILETLPREQVNGTKTFVKFQCFEKLEELTPSNKIEKDA